MYNDQIGLSHFHETFISLKAHSWRNSKSKGLVKTIIVDNAANTNNTQKNARKNPMRWCSVEVDRTSSFHDMFVSHCNFLISLSYLIIN